MPYKATIFFVSNRYLWSEAYFSTGTFDVNNVPAALSNLVNTRANLLGVGAEIYAVRVSNVPANRQVVDIDIGGFQVNGAFGQGLLALNQDPAFSTIPNVAMVIKCLIPSGSKLIYCAGIPKGVVEDAATPTQRINPLQVQGFADALQAWLKFLGTNQWGCQSQVNTVLQQAVGPPTDGPQTQPLIGITVAAQQPTWTVGSDMLVKGWKRVNPRSPGLTGRYILAAPLPTIAPWTYYLLNTQAVSPTNFKTIGKIGLLSQTIELFTLATLDTVTTRKRGVRTLGPLGRFSRSH